MYLYIYIHNVIQCLCIVSLFVLSFASTDTPLSSSASSQRRLSDGEIQLLPEAHLLLGGTQQGMVFVRENPIYKRMIWGYPPLWKPPYRGKMWITYG